MNASQIDSKAMKSLQASLLAVGLNPEETILFAGSGYAKRGPAVVDLVNESRFIMRGTGEMLKWPACAEKLEPMPKPATPLTEVFRRRLEAIGYDPDEAIIVMGFEHKGDGRAKRGESMIDFCRFVTLGDGRAVKVPNGADISPCSPFTNEFRVRMEERGMDVDAALVLCPHRFLVFLNNRGGRTHGARAVLLGSGEMLKAPCTWDMDDWRKTPKTE